MSFVNPVGSWAKPARVDMGVDYTGAGPLFAMGSGTIVNTKNSGWPGGTFIGLKLDNPIGGQQYVYYAENITPNVSVGQRVQAGQVIGHANGSSPFIEIGFAHPPGTGQTEADALGQDKAGLAAGDPGKFPTGMGVTMSNLISSLGGPAGVVSGQVQGTPSTFQATSASKSSASGTPTISCPMMLIAMPAILPFIPVIWSYRAIRNKREQRRNLSCRERANREGTREAHEQEKR